MKDTACQHATHFAVLEKGNTSSRKSQDSPAATWASLPPETCRPGLRLAARAAPLRATDEFNLNFPGQVRFPDLTTLRQDKNALVPQRQLLALKSALHCHMLTICRCGGRKPSRTPQLCREDQAATAAPRRRRLQPSLRELDHTSAPGTAQAPSPLRPNPRPTPGLHTSPWSPRPRGGAGMRACDGTRLRRVLTTPLLPWLPRVCPAPFDRLFSERLNFRISLSQG
ncbi:uncharacterized protein [Vicugna pacos]|uniref:Uncharacterized protein n=1 Tax=Vicugna pacos TaxID=30538 RepID=A0ABM5E5U3_VICPA